MNNSQIIDSKYTFAICISSSISFSNELCNSHTFIVMSSAILERIHAIQRHQSGKIPPEYSTSSMYIRLAIFNTL